MKHSVFSFFFLTVACAAVAQNPLTLEDIWSKGTFAAKAVPGFQSMADGKSYCKVDNNGGAQEVNRYDFATGNKLGLLFSSASLKDNGTVIGLDDFEFSKDEKKVLITNGFEPIYRHSGRSSAYVLDIASNTLTKISKQKVMYATLSPDGSKVAYVIDNNLYYTDLLKKKEVRVTKDGKHNAIINGAVDWVYEEEFSMSRGFEWSPDSRYIAYYRFDESQVPMFSMDIYGKLYPEQETWKYPKAGEKNSVVDVYIHKIGKKKPVKCETGSENDQYLPRIAWWNGELTIQRLNRHQNHLEILLASPSSGHTAPVYVEDNKYYIDVNDLTFVSESANPANSGAAAMYSADNEKLYFLSEKSGFNHLWAYCYTNTCFNGAREKQVTQGRWDIDVFLGIDPVHRLAYFTSGMEKPSERQLYSANLDNGEIKQLTTEPGWHTIIFSATFDYFLDNVSTMTSPPVFSVKDNTGKTLRVLEDNKALADKLATYTTGSVEFGQFTTTEEVALDYWIIKPKDFDPNKKYPVLFQVYGGPGYQTVKNAWGGANYMWHQLLAQKGYIIISIDNRGSGSRGELFKKMTYLNLGKYETTDYIEAAKYFGGQPYVDKNRIGIWGWSYGGFMASNCITRGADYFKAAIAVAPVTNWRFYDNIYTERYMRTPQENADGYDANSPITHVTKIKGNYLLIHGTADDNVHFQNSAEMVKAMNDNNIPYDTEYYPNKNHGIFGGKTRLHLFTKMTKFLEQNL